MRTWHLFLFNGGTHYPRRLDAIVVEDLTLCLVYALVFSDSGWRKFMDTTGNVAGDNDSATTTKRRR